jgi:hypothetical protein
MSLEIREFVKYLINEIKKEGIMSCNYYSDEEVENDVIDQI